MLSKITCGPTQLSSFIQLGKKGYGHLATFKYLRLQAVSQLVETCCLHLLITYMGRLRGCSFQRKDLVGLY